MFDIAKHQDSVREWRHSENAYVRHTDEMLHDLRSLPSIFFAENGISNPACNLIKVCSSYFETKAHDIPDCWFE
jgi:hypothetical protein